MVDMHLALVGGQSNPVGRGDEALAPPVTNGLGLEWANPGFVTLDDPGASPSPYAPQTGSMWPAFVNTLTAASAVPAGIVRSAVGGTSLLQAADAGFGGWWSGAAVFNNAVARYQAAIDNAVTAGFTPVPFLCWHEGETAAKFYPTQSTLEADYAAALVDLRERLNTALGVDLTVYVWRLGTAPDRAAGCTRIRNAQDTVCATVDGFEMVYTECVDFPARGWMKTDNLHYTQAGLNDMGTKGGAAVAAHLGYGTVIPVPTGPRSSLTARTLLRVL